MRPSRQWTWIAALVVVVILVLPMPIAERYTSPTQDGQYLLHPLRSYEFIWTAAWTTPSSPLSTSGKALAEAKKYFAVSTVRPTKVELLFLPDSVPYTYRTARGDVLTAATHGPFVWQVWGTDSADAEPSAPDVVALIDFKTGKVLSAIG